MTSMTKTVSENKVYILQEFDGAVWVNKGASTNKSIIFYLMGLRFFYNGLEPKRVITTLMK